MENFTKLSFFVSLIAIATSVFAESNTSSALSYAEIGSHNLSGSLLYNDNTESYTLSSSGDSIVSSDSFSFAYLNASSDFFAVEIEFLSQDMFTGDTASGIMFRSGLEVDAPFVAQQFSNSSNGHFYFQLLSRAEEGTDYQQIDRNWKDVDFPITLLLIKDSDSFTAYFPDDVGGTFQYSLTKSDFLETPFQVGVFVKSEDDSVLNSVEFNIKNVFESASDFANSGDDTSDEDDESSVSVSITASSYQNDANGVYLPAYLYDGDLDTESRWSALGQQWIQFEFSESVTFDEFHACFLKRNMRGQAFDLQTSQDGTEWMTFYSTTSDVVSEETAFQSFTFETQTTRFLRFVGYGNTQDNWNSVIEVSFLNDGVPVCDDDSSVNNNSGLIGDSFPDMKTAFFASFESGTITADVGEAFAQTSGGTVEDYFSVIDNPNPSSINSTDKVLLISVTNEGPSRAEYHTQKSIPTEEQTYIYTWKEMFPVDFATWNLHRNSWTSYVVGQWKTWPCEVCTGYNGVNYPDLICGNCGGIFNDREISSDGGVFDFRFRAKPDCDDYVNLVPAKGEWHAYTLEIYWTNTNDGYYDLYEDGRLIHSKVGVKTLFDYFIPETCNIQWGLGMYMMWWRAEGATSPQSLDYYLDDMAVFDVSKGVTIEEVLTWQGF